MSFNQKKFEQLFDIIAIDAFSHTYNLPSLKQEIIENICLQYDIQAYEKYKFLEGY